MALCLCVGVYLIHFECLLDSLMPLYVTCRHRWAVTGVFRTYCVWCQCILGVSKRLAFFLRLSIYLCLTHSLSRSSIHCLLASVFPFLPSSSTKHMGWRRQIMVICNLKTILIRKMSAAIGSVISSSDPVLEFLKRSRSCKISKKISKQTCTSLSALASSPNRCIWGAIFLQVKTKSIIAPSGDQWSWRHWPVCKHSDSLRRPAVLKYRSSFKMVMTSMSVPISPQHGLRHPTPTLSGLAGLQWSLPWVVRL